jgi:hypothetical protein
MTSPNSLPDPAPTSALPDPRGNAQDLPPDFPTVNGQRPPPPGATARNDRIMLDFLCAYYHLNRAYRRLLEARSLPEGDARLTAERESLQDVEKILIIRDRLEDLHAPLGVITEPVVRQGFTVDLTIKFGNVDAAGRRRTDLYTLTTVMPVPLPGPARLDDLPMGIEGPGFNGEY